MSEIFESVYDCKHKCSIYKKYMYMMISESLDNDEERHYLSFSENFYNFQIEHNITNPIDFKSIHYLDMSTLPSIITNPFRELQEELLEGKAPIKLLESFLLIDESGTHKALKYEIFITKKYLPSCKLKHDYNIIKSIPEHMEVYNRFHKKIDIGEMLTQHTLQNFHKSAYVQKEMNDDDSISDSNSMPSLVTDESSDMPDLIDENGEIYFLIFIQLLIIMRSLILNHKINLLHFKSMKMNYWKKKQKMLIKLQP